MQKLFRRVLGSLVLVVTTLLVTMPSASAATTGWVYVVYGSWNCPNGGKVTGIQAFTPLWQTNWDWGDDIIYPKVYTSQRTSITANLYCSGANGRPGMYVYSINRSISATGNNQTFWL